MKKDKVISAMEHIDADIINEADEYKGTDKKITWQRWAAMAACLCIVAAGVFFAKDLLRNRGSLLDSSDGEVISGDSSISEAQNPNSDDTGVNIPAMGLPDSDSEATLDMLGLVVYRGGIYSQTESYFGEEANQIDKLVGKYLGYAKGSLNEWSTQDDFAEEFASSVRGNVYEVAGYDTDFRICIREETEDEYGQKQLYIQFLDHLNGITLRTGEDLFETRLHLRDQITAIQWQSHDDWNYAKGNIRNASIEPELWDEFLDQIDKGIFVDVRASETSDSSVYDTDNQTHVFLTMEDGTVIRLWLIEGGYVGYNGLFWAFVRIPGEVFDSVFSACGGNV